MEQATTQPGTSAGTQGHERSAPGSYPFAPAVEADGRSGAKLHIAYYTDPLCSWSWAFEPQWRRLRQECGDQLTWRYHMAGMISNWQQYSDPINDISRPIQMGPQWYQVQAVSGMPLEDRLWFEDPPSSSYPGCVAVKAAEAQGAEAGERYLRLLREAAMLQGRNIARRQVRVEIAAELQALLPSFDAERFAADLDNPVVLEAFRDDIKDARYRNIIRFPTLILRLDSGRGTILVGYRPYHALQTALAALEPTLTFAPASGDAVDYLRAWGSATVQEIAEMFGMDRQVAAAGLQAAVAAGAAQQRGELYLAA
jgi:putative protein-disulfide isomerase